MCFVYVRFRGDGRTGGIHDLGLTDWEQVGPSGRKENYEEGLVWKRKMNLILDKFVSWYGQRRSVFVLEYIGKALWEVSVEEIKGNGQKRRACQEGGPAGAKAWGQGQH